MRNIKTWNDALSEAMNVATHGMHRAAKEGDLELVKSMLERGADINEKDKRGKTPLFYAVDAGNTDMARLLISNGADPKSALRGTKDTLWFFSGDIEWWPEAATRKKLMSVRAALGKRLLHSAENEYIDEVLELLWDGADPNARDKQGNTPLILLLGSRPPGKHITLGPEHTIFPRTASALRMVEGLLSYGADPNATNDKGNSALHFAIGDGWDHRIVKVLLENGADPNIKNEKGDSPVSLVTEKMYDFKKKLKELVYAGADASDINIPQELLLDVFGDDIDRIPEGPLKSKVQRMKRGRSAFGM